MIEHEAPTRIFRTSEKGIEFLKIQREFEARFHGIAIVVLTKSDYRPASNSYPSQHIRRNVKCDILKL